MYRSAWRTVAVALPAVHRRVRFADAAVRGRHHTVEQERRVIQGLPSLARRRRRPARSAAAPGGQAQQPRAGTRRHHRRLAASPRLPAGAPRARSSARAGLRQRAGASRRRSTPARPTSPPSARSARRDRRVAGHEGALASRSNATAASSPPPRPAAPARVPRRPPPTTSPPAATTRLAGSPPMARSASASCADAKPDGAASPSPARATWRRGPRASRLVMRRLLSCAASHRLACSAPRVGTRRAPAAPRSGHRAVQRLIASSAYAARSITSVVTSVAHQPSTRAPRAVSSRPALRATGACAPPAHSALISCRRVVLVGATSVTPRADLAARPRRRARGPERHRRGHPSGDVVEPA